MSSDPTRRWQHVNDTTNLTWVYMSLHYLTFYSALHIPLSYFWPKVLHTGAYASHVILWSALLVLTRWHPHKPASVNWKPICPLLTHLKHDIAMLHPSQVKMPSLKAPPLFLNVRSWSVESVGFVSLGVLGVVKKKSWDASAPGSACEAVKAWIERLRSSLVLLLHSNCKIRAIQGVSHRNVLYITAHVQASCSCSLLSTAAKCCKAWTLRISLIMFNSNRHWLIRIIRHWNSMKFVNV